MSYRTILYFLSLLGSFVIYWILATLGTVAASFSSFVSVILFVCIIHFGISSWLYFFLPLIGKILAIFTALIICLWPVTILIDGINHNKITHVLFALSLIFPNILAVYLHIRMFRNEQIPIGNLRKTFMSVPPLGLSLYTLYFLLF